MGMPWVPELFTAPALQQVLDKRRVDALVAVPYFDGLLAGDAEALVESFADEPEVHDPVRGRIKGVTAFRAYVAEASAWLRQHHTSVEDVEHVILQGRGFEEVVLHLDGDDGPVVLPVVIVADRLDDGRIDEVRLYYGSGPAGRHTSRPPLLQPDPALVEPGGVADYVRALGAGDVDAILAAFERDGGVSQPMGAGQIHRGADGLRAFFDRLFSHGGGIAWDLCGIVDDGRACALEYDVVRWGRTTLPPQAGVAVFIRGRSGKLAAVRVYDDTDPALDPDA
jgi:ketosteroid isomerase-like protein